MTKMTFAIDGFRAVFQPRTSGAIYVRQLASALAACSEVERVYILVPMMGTAGTIDPPANMGDIQCIDAGLSYDPSASFRLQTRWIQWDIPTMLKRQTDIDCFVAPYHYTPLVRTHDLTVATVVHDVCGLTYLYPKTKLGFYRHLAMLLTAATRADVIIPISQQTRKQFCAKFRWARPRLTAPVYNGIDDRTLEPDEVGEGLDKLSIVAGTYFFGLAAEHPRKGTDLLLAAYEKYRAQGGKKRLVLLGGEANRRGVLQGLHTSPHSDVVFLPKVTNELRNCVYAGAVALVFPSRCEGFGYPILEGMRQGCPSIADVDSPASEILGGLVPLLTALEPKEIMDKMLFWEARSEAERNECSRMLIERSMVLGEDFGTDFVRAAMGHRL